MPKISVIIPTYNRAYIIKKSIESVLNQTYTDFELIIVDDGSTDNTKAIVFEFNDPRIEYYRLEKNQGVSIARNYGISKAHGEYIAFHDSDDECLPEKLAKQLDYLESHYADVVFCNFLRPTCGGRNINHSNQIEEKDIHNLLLYGNFIGSVTLFGKKECFVNEPFDNTMPPLEDWEIMIRITKRYKVIHLNEVLVHVFMQENSISINHKENIKAIGRIIQKYSDIGWFSDEVKIYLYRHLVLRASQANLPLKNYYYKAWTVNHQPKYLILQLMASLKCDKFFKRRYQKLMRFFNLKRKVDLERKNDSMQY